MKKTGRNLQLVFILLCLTGCGVNMPDLSEKEERLITEYATQLLVKYNDNSEKYLLSAEKLKEEEQKEENIRERKRKTEEAKEIYANSQNIEKQSGENSETDLEDSEAEKENLATEHENLENNGDLAVKSLDEFLKLDEFRIQYKDYKLCNHYPDLERTDDILSISAEEGYKLLVLEFQVENLSDKENILDIFEKQCRYFLSVNGEKPIESDATLLLDDLSMYRESLKGKERKELVLLFEIEEIEQIDSLEMTVVYGTEKGKLNLQ